MAYCSSTDIEAFFGSEAATDWADKDLDGSADSGAVDYAIAVADDYIDARFRGSRYQVPLEQPSSSTAPVRIKYLSARLAGLTLYEHWGLGSDKAERMALVRQQCEEEIKLILAGEMLLDAKEN